jgi:hypothetical protein
MSGEVVLTQYAIYEHPRDDPANYIVRGWDIVRGASEPRPHRGCFRCATLEQARDWIERFHPGLYDLGRDADDPVIVAVYT